MTQFFTSWLLLLPNNKCILAQKMHKNTIGESKWIQSTQKKIMEVTFFIQHKPLVLNNNSKPFMRFFCVKMRAICHKEFVVSRRLTWKVLRTCWQTSPRSFKPFRRGSVAGTPPKANSLFRVHMYQTELIWCGLEIALYESSHSSY